MEPIDDPVDKPADQPTTPPTDPMPPEPIFVPDPTVTVSVPDLTALIAMGFEQGYRTGKAHLKFPPGVNEAHERQSMAYSYAMLLVKERPWEGKTGPADSANEEAAIEDAAGSPPRVVVP